MNHRKKISRLFVGALSVIMIMSIIMSFTFIGSFAVSDKYDIIFVVDDTTSMQTTDPSKLSVEAVKQYIDKLPDSLDIKFGITRYAIDVMSDSLDLGQDKDSIKKFTEDYIKQDGKGTDAATGINWAVEQFVKNSDSSRDKHIILIGDGENSYKVGGVYQRTDAESQAMLDAAVEQAKADGIKVYTIALNPTEKSKEYFAGIANKTGGKSYTPKDTTELSDCLDKIISEEIGSVTPPTEIILKPYEEVEFDFDIPLAVFELNFQCSHNAPIEITFTDPNGTVLDEKSNNVKKVSESSYTNFKLFNPIEGKWKVKFKNNSDEEQKIKVQFVYYTNLTLELSVPDTVVKDHPAKYIAKVFTEDGSEVKDNDRLTCFTGTLTVIPVDAQGNEGTAVTVPMTLDKAKFTAEHTVSDFGKYKIYAEISVSNSVIQKSPDSIIDVTSDKAPMPGWVIPVIILVCLILVAVIVVIMVLMGQGKPGSAQIRGNVAIKITGRSSTGEANSFDQDNFDCNLIFSKKNILTDLIIKYCDKFRIINSSTQAERTLNQFISPTLYDVTNKITIGGNKKKQTTVIIPAEYEMQVDGSEITKPQKITFSSSEGRTIELRFKNNGYAYSITLTFTGEGGNTSVFGGFEGGQGGNSGGFDFGGSQGGSSEGFDFGGSQGSSGGFDFGGSQGGSSGGFDFGGSQGVSSGGFDF